MDDLEALLEMRDDGVGGHVAPVGVVVVAVVAGRGCVGAAAGMGPVARAVSNLSGRCEQGMYVDSLEDYVAPVSLSC